MKGILISFSLIIVFSFLMWIPRLDNYDSSSNIKTEYTQNDKEFIKQKEEEEEEETVLNKIDSALETTELGSPSYKTLKEIKSRLEGNKSTQEGNRYKSNCDKEFEEVLNGCLDRLPHGSSSLWEKCRLSAAAHKSGCIKGGRN